MLEIWRKYLLAGNRLAALILCGATMVLAMPAVAAKGGTDRPISGNCDALVTPTGPTTMTIALSCTISHLGRTTGFITQTVDQNGHITSQITYTAANGDQLSSTYDAQAIFDFPNQQVYFTGTETFVGGTGRFSNATGTATLSGHASLSDFIGFYTTIGRISY